jgi:DHA3 family macrolide efflux protein-like MFS transporter
MHASKRNLGPFLFLEAASITSVIAGSMVFIALPWLALELTGSAVSAGALIAITSIPGLFLSPILGTIIDRMGRRVFAIASDFLSAIAIIAIPVMNDLVEMNFALLVILSVFRAVVNPAGSTARKSLIPDVAVPGQLTLERANSLHEAVFATGFAIGPAIAAAFIAILGPFNVFYITAGFCLASAFFAVLIRVSESRGDGISETGSLLRDTALGLKTIIATPAVLMGMATVMTLAVVYMPTEMVVLPAHFNLLNDAASLGILISTMAAASVVGALLFETLQKVLKYSTILKLGFIGIGFAMMPMSLLPPTPIMLLLGAVLGFSWGPLMPMLNTVIQRVIPENMRGRVFGIEMTIWNAAPLLTMMVVGFAVDSFGVEPVYIILATLVLLVAAVISFNKANQELNHAQLLGSK